MKKSKLITRAMMADHNKIDELLMRFLESDGLELGVRYDLFENFSTKLERHFVLEEQAIYAFSGIIDSQDKVLMARLAAEHEEMLKMAARIKNALMTKQLYVTDELKILLKKHRIEEDTRLYPRLDEALNEEEKKYIKERIGEHYQEFNQ